MVKIPIRPAHRNAFRIAIICALPLEAEMVEYMFDRFWDDEGPTYGKAPGDQNAYTTGLIGNHNVVLAYMSEIGSNSAATLAAGLRSSFRGIEITFVVGICGVIPIHRQTKEEIVLGDCMISTAVVQYDFGKQYPQEFVSNNDNSSGLLSTEIKSLTSMLKTQRNRNRLNERLVAHLRTIQKKTRPTLKYPGIQRGRLFEPSYRHRHVQDNVRCHGCLNNTQVCSKDCDNIGRTDGPLIERQRLQVNSDSMSKSDEILPRVHFGRFGSANTVMKSGLDRDRIAEEHELVAFEMEGSGIWNNFPTVLIKSACDYADSHKSKEWQSYAAATSACGLRAFLERLEAPDEVPEAVISRLSVGKEQQSEAESSPSSVSPQYMIPLQRNKRFVGRESQLRELENRLFISQECQRLAIYGLGGVGKTQITLEFCYTIKARYPDYSIFWISLISEARFKQDYTKLAKTCSLGIDDNDNLVSTVQTYLSNETAGKWLMIVDNVDDKKLIFGDSGRGSVLDKLPRGETGMILFNTRFKDIAFDVADGNIINLNNMDHEEAKTFLFKSLQNDRQIQDESLVDELLEELTHLPLAIAQATSYMVKTSITISKYLDLMRNTEEAAGKLLNRDFRDHTRDKESRNAVATTWLLSFDQIRDQEPLAAEMLFFLSCIENKAIPLAILPGDTSDIERTNAVGVLVGYSFLSEQGNDMYDMHRLVHLAVKVWMQNRNVVGIWKERAVSHLVAIFPSRHWEYRALWRPFIPHTTRLLQDTSRMTTRERARLSLHLGICLEQEGRFPEAFIWVSDCVSKCEWMPEEDHFRLEAQRRLAFLYITNDRAKEAVEMMRHVVKISEKIYEDDDWRRLSAQHALANLYSKTGQAGEAIEIMQKIIAVEAKALEKNSLTRLMSIYSLAEAYVEDSQQDKAIELLEDLIATADGFLEDDNPYGLTFKHLLSLAYIEIGRGEEAVQLLEKVILIKDRVPQESYRHRVASHYALAYAYESCHETEKAISTMRYVVLTRQKYLPATHSGRLAAEKDLDRMIKAYENTQDLLPEDNLIDERIETSMG